MNRDRSHYIKTVRDASIPMDAAMHRLLAGGYAHAWNTTYFEFHDRHIKATPRADDNRACIGESRIWAGVLMAYIS